MELRQLQYFVKVAQKLHVTQAAEELHVAQSAVSRQIHQLEEQLGAQLFIQIGRNLQLTPVGKLFLKRAQEILLEVERAVIEVQEFMDPEVGEIRIAFPHSLGAHFIPALAASFLKEHPQVRFRFKQGKYADLLQMVVEREVDLAFISPFPAQHEQVTGEILNIEELFLVVPPDHRFAGRESVRLKELADEPFILFSEGYSLRSIVRGACIKAGFHPKVSFEGEETDTIRGLVMAGMGVSILPAMSLIHVAKEMQPVKIRITEPEIRRSIGLIRRAGENLPLVAEGFRQFSLQYFGVQLNGETR